MASGAHPEASLRQRTGEAFEQKDAIARLPDVGRTGAKGELAFQLNVLVPVHGIDFNVQRSLPAPGSLLGSG